MKGECGSLWVEGEYQQQGAQGAQGTQGTAGKGDE